VIDLIALFKSAEDGDGVLNRRLIYLNGLEVPSVTTLMKPLSSDFYSTVDPEVLNKAAKRGTAIHNAVENYAKFGIEDMCRDSWHFESLLKTECETR